MNSTNISFEDPNTSDDPLLSYFKTLATNFWWDNSGVIGPVHQGHTPTELEEDVLDALVEEGWEFQPEWNLV
jgi:hypothetical protein